MLFHLSIAAEHPARVATVVAELWGGKSFPFPQFPGAYVAIAGDERNSMIEVMPLDFEFVPGMGPAEAQGRINPSPSRFTAVHAAIASPLTEAEIHRIAEREGWIVKTCRRGGAFGVIELWLEDGFMLEVMTPEMQAEYQAVRAIDAWQEMCRQYDELQLAA